MDPPEKPRPRGLTPPAPTLVLPLGRAPREPYLTRATDIVAAARARIFAGTDGGGGGSRGDGAFSLDELEDLLVGTATGPDEPFGMGDYAGLYPDPQARRSDLVELVHRETAAHLVRQWGTLLARFSPLAPLDAPYRPTDTTPAYTAERYPAPRRLVEAYATWGAEPPVNEGGLALALEAFEGQVRRIVNSSGALDFVRSRLAWILVERSDRPLIPWTADSVDAYNRGRGVASLYFVLGLTAPDRQRRAPPIAMEMMLYSSRFERGHLSRILRIGDPDSLGELMDLVHKYDITLFYVPPGRFVRASTPAFIDRLFNPTKPVPPPE